MSQVLVSLDSSEYRDFSALFDLNEGRMGVTVTFLAILELLKEGLIDVQQAEPFAVIHVRAGQGSEAVSENAGN